MSEHREFNGWDKGRCVLLGISDNKSVSSAEPTETEGDEALRN